TRTVANTAVDAPISTLFLVVLVTLGVVGGVIEPPSSLSKLVRETLNMYRRLAKDKVVEVLTSIYGKIRQDLKKS
ncbi:MAG: hypothetical protein DRO13_04550, partial [Thermoprotei archaeon]